MPYSSAEGKMTGLHWCQDLGAKSFLDVGTGAGYWSRILRGSIGYPVAITGIEVWHPYVDQFKLLEKYNELIVSDARTTLTSLATTRRARWDVVIFGDVLEHVTKEEALVMWRQAQTLARMGVILSIPTVHYPQEGDPYGNPHEAHVKDDWSVDEVLSSFTGITEWMEGEEVSIFLAKTW